MHQTRIRNPAEISEDIHGDLALDASIVAPRDAGKQASNFRAISCPGREPGLEDGKEVCEIVHRLSESADQCRG